MMKERTLRVLEFTKIRDRLASKAMTDMGRERCEALVPSSNMTEIQRTMLEAYFVDKASDFKDAGLPESPSAVELMSYMRTRYGISNEYSAEQMRMIAGLRYSINVRYAVNTGEYVFVQDASMKLISSILENKLNGIEVKRSFTRQYHT